MNLVLVSIFGAPGSGKSTLAKRLVESLGAEHAVRVPVDYFLESSPFDTLEAFLCRPLRYDWASLEVFLQAGNGVALTTPAYDFEHFTRLSETGGRPLTMRPYPNADLLIYLHALAAERKKRIRARDRVWGTRTIEKWNLYQITMHDVFRLQYPIDLQLDGLENIEVLIDRVRGLLEQKGILYAYDG